jgi:hypothetical protein
VWNRQDAKSAKDRQEEKLDRIDRINRMRLQGGSAEPPAHHPVDPANPV